MLPLWSGRWVVEAGAGETGLRRFTIGIPRFVRLWSATAASNLGDGIGLAAANSAVAAFAVRPGANNPLLAAAWEAAR